MELSPPFLPAFLPLPVPNLKPSLPPSQVSTYLRTPPYLRTYGVHRKTVPHRLCPCQLNAQTDPEALAAKPARPALPRERNFNIEGVANEKPEQQVESVMGCDPGRR